MHRPDAGRPRQLSASAPNTDSKRGTADREGEPRPARAQMEHEDQEAQKPLLATAAGSSGDGRRGAASASSSSSSIAVVVASTAVAVAGSFEFGISVGYSSPSQPGIMRDLDLSLAEYSVFGSILTIGAMLGAIVSGTVADRVGRRFTMAISDLLCILGYLLITFSQNFWWLDIGRVSIGCGIGLLSYVVPVYISEITPKNLRGGFATVNQFMICCGASLAYVLGTFITWRTLAIIGAFQAELQKLRGKGVDMSEEAEEIKDFTEKLQHLPKSKVLDLFQKDYIHAVTVGVGLMALQQFGGVNAICFYASEIFVSAGFSSGNTGMLAMVAVQIPMTGLGVLLMEKAGRRPLLMISAAGTCLGCLLVGLSFLAKEHHWGKDLNILLALAGILVQSTDWLLFKDLNTLLALAGIFLSNRHTQNYCSEDFYFKPDFWWILFTGHGGNTMGYNVRDISHKHEGSSRKPCDPSKLAQLMDRLICLQLSPGVELLWHILHLRKHLWPHSCVCGTASARNKRKNPRRDSSLHELVLSGHLSQMICLSSLDSQICNVRVIVWDTVVCRHRSLYIIFYQ
ncbi:sugar transporter ERD6-like 5 isoform X2 [Panicum virgatum]|uniref:sugar transporter ERD6-like 5 isoform X2 n=1 Tax=Panicum virgatum TaxID=38727 RepID=UPI0019D4F67A|nr:sugar transporter ERD6-like 5 isoform X2 [Panicum virgatum]